MDHTATLGTPSRTATLGITPLRPQGAHKGQHTGGSSPPKQAWQRHSRSLRRLSYARRVLRLDSCLRRVVGADPIRFQRSRVGASPSLVARSGQKWPDPNLRRHEPNQAPGQRFLQPASVKRLLLRQATLRPTRRNRRSSRNTRGATRSPAGERSGVRGLRGSDQRPPEQRCRRDPERVRGAQPSPALLNQPQHDPGQPEKPDDAQRGAEGLDDQARCTHRSTHQ